MKKNVSKVLSLLMSIAMLVGMVSLPMAFAADGPVQVVLGSATGAVGTQVVLPLNISENSGACATNFEVSFDNTMLQFVSCKAGSIWTGLESAYPSINSTPVVSGTTSTIRFGFMYDNDDGLVEAGTMFNFTFKILPGLTESTNVNLAFKQNGKLTDINGALIPSELYGGKVSVPATTPTYEITFDANGGVGGGVQTVEEGDMPIVPADPTRAGYRFLNWDPTVVAATADATYTAVWEEIVMVTVTFDSKGGEPVAPLTGEVGTPIPFVDAVRTGYHFQGWDPAFTNFDIDREFSAIWIANDHLITFDADGGLGGEVQTVKYDATPVPPTVTKEGYTFVRWEPAVTYVTEDTTYTAIWELIPVTVYYTITFDAAGGLGGTVLQVEEGAMPQAPTVTREGYTFLGWDVEVALATADATYTAQWELIPVTVYYTITFDAAGGLGGTVLQVEEGTMPQAPTVTREGYTFLGWDVEVALATADATYTAQWELIPVTVYYEITFDMNGGEGGDIVLLVEEGVMPVVPTPTYEGYTFLGWDVEVAVATADATYVAQWELIPVTVYYTITFDAAGGLGGTVLQVEEGTMPQAPTVTREGYTFLGWDVEVAVATADATYTATWQLIPVTVYYTITFDAAGGLGGTSLQVEEGTMPQAPTVTREGYTFLGWDVEVALATADATYTATWELNPGVTFTISFDLNDGENVEVLTFAEGDMPAIADPIRAGYIFLGWTPEIVAATADATYTARWLGDVDGDGVIGVNDALMVLQASTGLITLTAQQFEAADVNGDGRLSSLDALMILHFVSGKTTTFPSQGA